jgi:hypothetical protein
MPRLQFIVRPLGILAIVAAATGALADDRAGRYAMSPAEGGGMIRLDTDTGMMSLCARKADQWACEPMKDSQAALTTELDRLKAENKALKDEVKRMEEVFALGGDKRHEDTGPPGGRPSGKLDLPSEKDVDKAFDYLESMMKKFKERLKRLDQPEKPSQPL